MNRISMSYAGETRFYVATKQAYDREGHLIGHFVEWVEAYTKEELQAKYGEIMTEVKCDRCKTKCDSYSEPDKTRFMAEFRPEYPWISGFRSFDLCGACVDFIVRNIQSGIEKSAE